MKILQLSPKPYFPPHDGGALAMLNLAKSLMLSGADVKVISIETEKHPAFISPEYVSLSKRLKMEFFKVDTSIRYFDAFRNLFRSTPYNLDRFYSKKFELFLKEHLISNPYDVVVLEGLFVSPYLDVVKGNTNAKVVYRAHNVESGIWGMLAKNERSHWKKSYLNLLAKRLEVSEDEILKKVDGSIFITKEDERHFSSGLKTPFITLPFCIDMNEYIPAQQSKNKLVIGFIGSLDWQPNVEGLTWFIENVWTKHSFPENVVLRIAGRNASDYFKSLNLPNVEFFGQVDNAKEFIRGCDIFISPLFSGSGIRVKIIEAMALGKPVVTNELAFQGIEGKEEITHLRADSPESFSKALQMLISNEEKRLQMGASARNLVKEKYSIEQQSKTLVEFLNGLN